MSTGNSIDLAAIERFAESVSPSALGVWFNPHTMAQTMLALVQFGRDAEDGAVRRLRQYDSITLDISILLDNSGALSKKQIVARLREIYAGAGGPR